MAQIGITKYREVMVSQHYGDRQTIYIDMERIVFEGTGRGPKAEGQSSSTVTKS